MDEIDRRILRVLQKQGRASNAELATRVHLSESACSRRMRQLEADGVIAGYACVLDPRRVGLGLTVFLTVTLVSQAEATLKAFEDAIGAVPEVIECYLMTGQADYQVQAVVADVDAYEALHARTMTRLPGVARITSSIALRTVVRRAGLPV